MDTTQSNSSLTGDHLIATKNPSDSCFLDSQLPELECLQENEEHEEFKDICAVDDDHSCSVEGCDLDHKTLACLLSSTAERFNCNEGYQDHKDDLREDSPDNNEGKAVNRVEGAKHRLGSLIDSDQLSNCGSISCRSSSTRSFAFPILESEWPDSPVRMVEADRRHHRGWRNSFLCCKF